MYDFSDKIVVVTGASRGIGREIAEHFHEAGATVAICSRSMDDIRNVVSEINDKSRIFGQAADMSDLTEMENFLGEVIEKFGRIDILVNNAGVQFPKNSDQVTESDWDNTVNTNMKGYFFCAQFAAKDMMRRKSGGCIINIGSVNAMLVIVGQAVYSSTKAAVMQMTRSLGREWARAGIRVNSVAPGSIPTAINAAIYADPNVEKAMCEKIPMGRRGTTREVAEATLFLASEYASYITGQTLFVDGGLTLVHG